MSTVDEHANTISSSSSSREKGLFVLDESEYKEEVIGTSANILDRIDGGTISSGLSVNEEELDSNNSRNADKDNILLGLLVRTSSQRRRK